VLLDSASNQFSQFGEDGVIGRIFDVIGEISRVCCEFGAWDGIHLSNTRALVGRGWRAVMSEAGLTRADPVSNYGPQHLTIKPRSTIATTSSQPFWNRTASSTSSTSSASASDGEDLSILRNLGVSPRLIFIEAIATHDPDAPEVDRSVAAAPSASRSTLLRGRARARLPAHLLHGQRIPAEGRRGHSICDA
jgi:hypothetical protein